MVCRSGRFLTSTYISKLGVDPKKFYDKGLRERESSEMRRTNNEATLATVTVQHTGVMARAVESTAHGTPHHYGVSKAVSIRK